MKWSLTKFDNLKAQSLTIFSWPGRQPPENYPKDDLVDREDVWMDASGAPTWHGKSAMSWLKRLLQSRQRVSLASQLKG